MTDECIPFNATDGTEDGCTVLNVADECRLCIESCTTECAEGLICWLDDNVKLLRDNTGETVEDTTP